jgi:hypothetical protein
MLKAALPWVLAAALAFGLSAVAGTSYTEPPPEAGSQPAAVPAQACPPGFAGVWVDSTTAECLRELP